MTENVREPDGSSRPALTAGVGLFRAIGLALDWRKLVLAAVALWFTSMIGWALGIRSPESGPTLTYVFPGGRITSQPGPDLGSPIALATGFVGRLIGPLGSTRSLGFWQALFGLVAILAVWGVLGAAIARIALVQAATRQNPGLLAGLRFAGRKFVPILVAPLTLLAAILALGLLNGLLGLVLHLGPAVGGTIVGGLLGLPLFLSLLTTWLIVALAAGWPLMVASVAAENEDTFDALSRSVSYVFQRPLHYLFWMAVAAFAGLLGLYLVTFLYQTTLSATAGGLALGAPSGLSHDVLGGLTEPRTGPGATLARGWLTLAEGLARGWIFSYAWCASGLIYLLLRREVDGTPCDDIDLAVEPEASFAPGLEGPGPAKVGSEAPPVVEAPATE